MRRRFARLVSLAVPAAALIALPLAASARTHHGYRWYEVPAVAPVAPVAPVPPVPPVPPVAPLPPVPPVPPAAPAEYFWADDGDPDRIVLRGGHWGGIWQPNLSRRIHEQVRRDVARQHRLILRNELRLRDPFVLRDVIRSRARDDMRIRIRDRQVLRDPIRDRVRIRARGYREVSI